MSAIEDRTLTLTRTLAATPEQIWRCWTEPKLMKEWFVPRPWTLAEAEVDLRVGGTNRVVMRNPEGELFPSVGVYLELIPDRRLVFTDAFVSAWVPSEKPFFVGSIDLESQGPGKTLYVARARHWTVEDAEAHRAMGFLEGWGLCADQLEALARTM